MMPNCCTCLLIEKKVSRINNRGYEPQGKLCGSYPPLCGIISNSLWQLDNSTKKLQCALLLKF